MSSWQEYRLGDYIKVKHGYAFKGKEITTEETDNILVTPGNFHIGGGFKSDKFKYFNGEYTEEYVLNENDIVVTMTDLSKETDTLGYSAKIPKTKSKKYLHNQRIGLLEFLNNDIDKDFIYWLLRTREYQGYIVGSASGTSIMHTSPSRIEDYVFNAPKIIDEQKTISEILNSFEEKINILINQNKTLEKLSQTIFRQWFIEKAKEWEEKPLNFFGDIICGKTPSKKKPEYHDGEVPFIKIPDMHGNTFIFDTMDTLTFEGRDSQKNKTLPKKSICVSCIATVGLVSMNIVESQTNQQINSIIPKEEKFRYYLYLFMQSSNELLHAMASGGTATLNLNTSSFSKIEIPLPDDKILYEFHSLVEPNFDKIFANQKQINTLKDISNTLIPKLMNGEVRVKY